MTNTVIDDAGNPTNETTTHLGIRYVEFVPHHTAAIQQLNAKITVLENILEEIGFEIKSLNNTASDQQISVTLNNKNKLLLGLPHPNPNNGEASISVFVPEQTSGVVEFLFTDALGQPLEIVTIEESGTTAVKLNTTNLTSGTYYYTLMLDGEAQATRKMLRE